MENIQPINPVALKIGSLPIHWYGVIIGVGLLLALYLAIRESDRRGLHKDTFPDLMIWAIPISIISARIYYVIFEWSNYYKDNPGDIIKIWNGGIAIHGALIGAVLTAYFYARAKNISFWKLTDIAAPSIILGQAIGRWGNFINQEAHGGEVTRSFLEGLYLPDFIVNQMYINGAYYHPTFFYEFLWNIIGFVILIVLRKVNLRSGEIFFSYVIWYSIGRFYIEGLRTDSLIVGDLKMAQFISLVLIVLSVISIIYRRKSGKANERYLDRSAS